MCSRSFLGCGLHLVYLMRQQLYLFMQAVTRPVPFSILSRPLDGFVQRRGGQYSHNLRACAKRTATAACATADQLSDFIKVTHTRQRQSIILHRHTAVENYKHRDTSMHFLCQYKAYWLLGSFSGKYLLNHSADCAYTSAIVVGVRNE